MRVVAIFGPTAVGKTAVAVALAGRLRARGEDPVAVSCDAIQVYRGLEALSGAPGAPERKALEHRLVAFLEPSEEFSAGRFGALARAEIDRLLGEGRRPIVVGGTGLYLRVALSDIELRPPAAPRVREGVEAELAKRGPEALHAELEPGVAAGIHPRDRRRVARATELQRSGSAHAPRAESGGELWTARLRHPTLLVALTMSRRKLEERIAERVEEMARAGAGEEARRAAAVGVSRTARSAIGFEGFARGDLEAVKTAQRRFAKRQMTWMRRMEGVRVIERDGGEEEVAARIEALLGDTAPR
ncbi:MAG: tRNA (adenosine(37)-N6)-dimethylallyltransferase MiaA [Solirubrobacterales bacterium]